MDRNNQCCLKNIQNLKNKILTGKFNKQDGVFEIAKVQNRYFRFVSVLRNISFIKLLLKRSHHKIILCLTG